MLIVIQAEKIDKIIKFQSDIKLFELITQQKNINYNNGNKDN